MEIFRESDSVFAETSAKQTTVARGPQFFSCVLVWEPFGAFRRVREGRAQREKAEREMGGGGLFACLR